MRVLEIFSTYKKDLKLVLKQGWDEKAISKVSGIAKDWNRSVFNKKSSASKAFFELIANLKAKFVLISFNSEGFINQDEFDKNLNKMGKVHLLRQKYNAYRGSRNLKARNIHVDELLYVLKK